MFVCEGHSKDCYTCLQVRTHRVFTRDLIVTSAVDMHGNVPDRQRQRKPPFEWRRERELALRPRAVRGYEDGPTVLGSLLVGVLQRAN